MLKSKIFAQLFEFEIFAKKTMINTPMLKKHHAKIAFDSMLVCGL